ncbi:tetratricopeptide repeat protein [Sandaracinus amylolyticus]|nr:tetratricopeptide repeat protein [Sandaracinus amylolyticus]
MRALVLIVALLVAPSVVRAQDDDEALPIDPPADAQPPADTSRDEEARALFAAGRTAFEAGRFSDALSYFQRSYELSGRSMLLFNIGSAHDRMRQDVEALAAFEAYLRAVPNAPNAREVEARVEVLRRAIAQREPAPETTVEAPAPEPEIAIAPEVDPAPVAPQPAPERAFAPIGSSILGGLALITGGVAVWSWVDANARYEGLETGCFAMRGACTDAEIDASGVDTQVTVTNVLLASSLALAAAAVVVLVLEIPMGGDDDEGAPAVALRAGPTSVAVEGRF